ncbi:MULTISPECIES: HNH endonuclease family protein [Bacteria]
MRRGRGVATASVSAILVLVVGVIFAVFSSEQDASPAPASPITVPTGAAGSALAVLETLEVKGRAPKTGYSRDEFGSAWLDVDRNGCDTRNDILARDLTAITGSGTCRVLTGTLADPYTADTISFVRGQGTSELVQIDHVVALSDAWQKGASQLSPDVRVLFANDPLNLLAVDGQANSQKGDGDAATWLPPNRTFRCAYVARQVSVKAAYGLWVTSAEHDAIARVLASCPDEPALAATEPLVSR